MKHVRSTGGHIPNHELEGKPARDAPRPVHVPAGRGGGGGALGSALNSDRRPRGASAPDRGRASIAQAEALGLVPASSLDVDDVAARQELVAAEPGAVVAAADNGEVAEAKSFKLR